MNKRLGALLGIALLLFILSSVPTSAHNISVVKPTKLVVDIGDLMRWLSQNPGANPPDPSVDLLIIVKNQSTTSVIVSITLTPLDFNEYIGGIDCPSPTTVSANSSRRFICTVETNVVENTSKLFSGPELNIPFVLELNITDSSGNILNKYEENVYLLVVDTNDASWTILRHFDEENIPVFKFTASASGHESTDIYCYEFSDSVSAIYPKDSTTCIKAPCYDLYGYTIGARLDINDIDFSFYTECVLTGYAHSASTSYLTKLVTSSSEEINSLCFSNSTLIWYKPGQVAFTLQLSKEANHVYFLHDAGSLTYYYLDELRIYCR